MRWVKFIKHVCEIHFKRTGKINAEVHMVHNQDPHLHGPATAEKRRRGEKKKGGKHLIWDKHFLLLSLFGPPPSKHPPPPTTSLPSTPHQSLDLTATARNHNHKIIKMLFGCH